MKQSKVMRITAVVFLAAAAITGGYSVYRAERTVPVLVATHDIAPYTFVTASDFTMERIPAGAVFSDVAHSAMQVSGHMTTMEILNGAQIRAGMFNQANSMQGMVNLTSQPGQVTFSLPYRSGSLDTYVAPDSYVDLVSPGPNNTPLHAEHVHVLSNTGYIASPTAPTSANQQSAPVLIMTLPQVQYMAMQQAIAGSNVQVLMVPQQQQMSSGYQMDSGLNQNSTSQNTPSTNTNQVRNSTTAASTTNNNTVASSTSSSTTTNKATSKAGGRKK